MIMKTRKTDNIKEYFPKEGFYASYQLLILIQIRLRPTNSSKKTTTNTPTTEKSCRLVAGRRQRCIYNPDKHLLQLRFCGIQNFRIH